MWEYKILCPFNEQETRDFLESNGNNGWELVSAVHLSNSNCRYLYFKRKKISSGCKIPGKNIENLLT